MNENVLRGKSCGTACISKKHYERQNICQGNECYGTIQ
nr:MAG TPA: Defensin-1, Scorpion, Centruroides limpidus limpidus [Caudoviricetes sp.]